MIGDALVGAVLLLLATPAGDAVPAEEAAALRALELEIVAAVNRYRDGRGLNALTEVPEISRLARGHSAAMAAGRTGLGHQGLRDRVLAISESVAVTRVSENISRHDRRRAEVPDAAMRRWVGSTVHRKNLAGRFDLTGVGAAKSPDGAYYLTQLFVASKAGVGSP